MKVTRLIQIYLWCCSLVRAIARNTLAFVAASASVQLVRPQLTYSAEDGRRRQLAQVPWIAGQASIGLAVHFDS